MRKLFLFILILLMGVFLVGCQNSQYGQYVGNEEPTVNDEADKKAIASLVENFGKKLQMVSLLAPPNIVNKSMQDNFLPFSIK